VRFLRRVDGKINWWLFTAIVVGGFVVREAVCFVFHV